MVERTTAVCSQCGIKFEMAKPSYLKNLKEGKPILCPECRKKERSKKMAERMANMSEEEKKAMYKKASTNSKKFFDKMKKENPEAFEARMNRVNAGAQKWRENETEEERRRISEIHSESNRHRWENMTTSEKEAYKQNARNIWANKTEEEKEKHRQHSIDMWANLSQEEYDQRRANHSKAHKEYLDNLSDFEISERSAKIAKGVKNWLSTMSMEDYRKYILDRTKNLPENKLSLKFEEEFRKQLSIGMRIIKEYPTFNYDQNETKYIHSWDYGILDSNDNIILLIDIDGNYFHADTTEYDYNMARESSDVNRVLAIPDGVKVMVAYEQLFDESINWFKKIINMTFDQWKELIFNYYHNMPFPYPTYDIIDMMKSFNRLPKIVISNKHFSVSAMHIRVGDHIIFNFHRSIWHSNKDKHMTPYNAWYNENIMKDMISHHLFIHNHLNKNKITQGFMVSDIAPRVPVFSAARAMILMERLMKNVHEVFDPYPEFSGRMLAAIANKCKYIAYENDQTLYNERQNMLSFLNNNGIETDVTFTIQGSGSFQCMFTSVSNMKNQDQIIDDLISRYKCQQYVLIASDIEKYMNRVEEVIYNISPCDPPIEYIIIIYSNNSIK